MRTAHLGRPRPDDAPHRARILRRARWVRSQEAPQLLAWSGRRARRGASTAHQLVDKSRAGGKGAAAAVWKSVGPKGRASTTSQAASRHARMHSEYKAQRRAVSPPARAPQHLVADATVSRLEERHALRPHARPAGEGARTASRNRTGRSIAAAPAHHTSMGALARARRRSPSSLF